MAGSHTCAMDGIKVFVSLAFPCEVFMNVTLENGKLWWKFQFIA